MRSRNVKIHLEIPVGVNSDGISPYYNHPSFEDDSGIVYEQDEIVDACDIVRDVLRDGEAEYPIYFIGDSDDSKAKIGIAEQVRYNAATECIEVDGTLECGGVIDDYIFSEPKNYAVSMTIDAFWI